MLIHVITIQIHFCLLCVHLIINSEEEEEEKKML